MNNGKALDVNLPHLNAHWNNANYRTQCRVHQQHQQALAYDKMDAALIAANKRWPVDWTEQEKLDATAKLKN